jgi:hypothetical protein
MASTGGYHRAVRVRAAASLLLVALLAACDGGDGTVTPPPTTSGSPSPIVTGTDGISGTFRACHRSRKFQVVLILFFEARDPSILAAGGGNVVFDVVPVEPTRWSNGDRVEVEQGSNEDVRQIHVPEGVVPPDEMTLRVSASPPSDPSVVLATNEAVTIGVPGAACLQG